MAKKTSIQANNTNPGFVQGKTSIFEASVPNIPYYQKLRHIKGSQPMANSFVADFNSQVNPTLIPGQPIYIASQAQTVTTFRLLTEVEFNLLTELGDNLRIE